METKNTLLKNAGIVLSISILAKLISFLTEIVLAAYMGTSEQADAYNMVIGVKQVLYPMLSIGIWKVFLPEYKKISIEKGDNKAFRFASKIINIFFVYSSIITILIIIFANTIVSIVAPGFAENTKDITVTLLRISSPQYIFIIMASILSAILQAHGKFFGSQIREVASFIPIIISALLFYNKYGVYSVSIGLLLGSVFRFVVTILFMSKDFKHKLMFDFKDKTVISILKNMPSALATAGVSQLNTLVDKIMASSLKVGTVSSLSYGQRLINVFSGLITGSINTVFYPSMAEFIANDDIKGLRNNLTKIIFVISSILIPITVFSFIYSFDIVSLVYERGKFDSLAAYRTAEVFRFYSLGILFVGFKDIVSNVYYSFGDTKTTLKITIIMVITNISLNIVLIKYMDSAGLALATSISSIVGTSLLFYKLKEYILLDYNTISTEVVRIFSASLAASIASMLTVLMVKPDYVFVKLIIILIVGVITYFLILKLNKSLSLKYVTLIINDKIYKDKK